MPQTKQIFSKQELEYLNNRLIKPIRTDAIKRLVSNIEHKTMLMFESVQYLVGNTRVSKQTFVHLNQIWSFLNDNLINTVLINERGLYHE